MGHHLLYYMQSRKHCEIGFHLLLSPQTNKQVSTSAWGHIGAVLPQQVDNTHDLHSSVQTFHSPQTYQAKQLIGLFTYYLWMV